MRQSADRISDNLFAWLRWIVERCLAKDPGERYTAGSPEVSSRLNEFPRTLA
jgi:hypothetical protein